MPELFHGALELLVKGHGGVQDGLTGLHAAPSLRVCFGFQERHEGC